MTDAPGGLGTDRVTPFSFSEILNDEDFEERNFRGDYLYWIRLDILAYIGDPEVPRDTPTVTATRILRNIDSGIAVHEPDDDQGHNFRPTYEALPNESLLVTLQNILAYTRIGILAERLNFRTVYLDPDENPVLTIRDPIESTFEHSAQLPNVVALFPFNPTDDPDNPVEPVVSGNQDSIELWGEFVDHPDCAEYEYWRQCS